MFVIVSRAALIESNFSTVICAPVYSSFDGLSTQVMVGTTEGLKHESSIHCDELVSIQKSSLTDFVGRMGDARVSELNQALSIAIGCE